MTTRMKWVSTSSYYTRSRRTIKLNFDTRESQMTFVLSTIYPSALVIISLPTPSFHCMFTWLPSLLCISGAGHKKRKTVASWTGQPMHWLSFYVGNFRETWTQHFNSRDALFLLFNFRDLCVGPPLYPPLGWLGWQGWREWLRRLGWVEWVGYKDDLDD